MRNAISLFKRYRALTVVSSRSVASLLVAATIAAVLVVPRAHARDLAAPFLRDALTLPGRPAPELARLFTPSGAPAGSYRVSLLSEGIEAARRIVAGAIAPGADPGDAKGAWRIELKDPLEAFGIAGTYDRSRVARLYGGTRVAVVRAPIRRDGRTVAAVTLFSPHPDAALSRLEPGTLVILFVVDRCRD
jgi:hypothetical protein